MSNDQKMGIIHKIKDFFRTHKTIAEILRFLVIGGFATVIDFIVMGVVLYLFDSSLYASFLDVFFSGESPTTLATIIGTGAGFVAGLIFNYIFSIIFVYEEKGNSKSGKGFILFALLSLVGLGIHLLGMWIGYEIIGINEWAVKITLTIIVLIYNYISKKLIIFKDNKTKDKTIKIEH